MICKIQINMSNAAFDECPASEIARILRKLADQIEHGELPPITLRDINGNTVGNCRITNR